MEIPGQISAEIDNGARQLPLSCQQVIVETGLGHLAVLAPRAGLEPATIRLTDEPPTTMHEGLWLGLEPWIRRLRDNLIAKSPIEPFSRL
jgi:hypothetical protein